MKNEVKLSQICTTNFEGKYNYRILMRVDSKVLNKKYNNI